MHIDILDFSSLCDSTRYMPWLWAMTPRASRPTDYLHLTLHSCVSSSRTDRRMCESAWPGFRKVFVHPIWLLINLFRLLAHVRQRSDWDPRAMSSGSSCTRIQSRGRSQTDALRPTATHGKLRSDRFPRPSLHVQQRKSIYLLRYRLPATRAFQTPY